MQKEIQEIKFEKMKLDKNDRIKQLEKISNTQKIKTVPEVLKLIINLIKGDGNNVETY